MDSISWDWEHNGRERKMEAKENSLDGMGSRRREAK
jgi:hypothetical protein